MPGELAQLALERHEVGDHLDGLDRRGVAVGPAGELVQVVADARDLASALALGVGRRRGPRPRPRHRLPQQVGQRHAGGRRLRPPVGDLGGRGAQVDLPGAAASHQAHRRGVRGAEPSAGRPGRATAARGSRGAQRPPRQPPCVHKGSAGSSAVDHHHELFPGGGSLRRRLLICCSRVDSRSVLVEQVAAVRVVHREVEGATDPIRDSGRSPQVPATPRGVRSRRGGRLAMKSSTSCSTHRTALLPIRIGFGKRDSAIIA